MCRQELELGFSKLQFFLQPTGGLPPSSAACPRPFSHTCKYLNRDAEDLPTHLAQAQGRPPGHSGPVFLRGRRAAELDVISAPTSRVVGGQRASGKTRPSQAWHSSDTHGVTTRAEKRQELPARSLGHSAIHIKS